MTLAPNVFFGFGVILHDTIPCYTLPCYTILYYTTPYHTMLFYTILLKSRWAPCCRASTSGTWWWPSPLPPSRGASKTVLPRPQTPGRIQKVDPPPSSILHTIGVLESRIGRSTFWILPGVWVLPQAAHSHTVGSRKLECGCGMI